MIEIFKSKKDLLNEIAEFKKILGISDISNFDEAKNIKQGYQFQQIVLNSPNPIFTIDNDGSITHWNNACEKILGFEQSIIGKNIYSLQPKCNNHIFSELIVKTKNGDSFSDIELNLKSNSGEKIFFISRIYPVFDYQHEVEMIVFANTDITERRSKKSVEFMEDLHYRSLVDNLSQIVFRIDLNGNLVYINKTGIEKFGIDSKILKNNPKIYDYLDKDYTARFNYLCKEIIEKQEPATDEIVYINKDGEHLETYTFLNPIIEYKDLIGFNAVLTENSIIKAIENALKHSEKKYRDIFNSIHDGIIYTNSKGMVTDANPAFYSITNLNPEEVLNKFALHLATKLVSAKDIPRIIAAVSRGLSGDNFEGFVVKYRDKILDIKPLSIIAQSGAGAIIRDITEVTYSKELLEKSEREYKLVVENAIEAIFVIQEEKIVFSNTTLHNIMGMTAEELQKINFVDFIDPETRESAIENYYLRLSGEFLQSMVHKIFVKGKLIWVEFKGVVIEWNNIPAVLYFARDITEQKVAQEALIESENRYRELVEHSPAGIYEIDLLSRKFITINDFMCEYTGYSKEELYNMPAEALLSEDSQKEFFQKIRRLFNGEINSDVAEYQIVTKEKKLKWVLLVVKLIISEKSKTKARFVVHDVSERKRIEEEIAKYQRFLQSVLNSVPVILVCIDKNELITLLEGKGITHVNFNMKEFEGKPLKSLMKDFPDFMQEFDNVKTGLINKFTFRFGDNIFESHFSHVKNHAGETEYYIGVSIDVTDRVKYEEQIIESEKKYRLLLQSLNEGILVLDEEGITNFANPQLAEMLGYTQNEIIDNHILTFVHDESKENASKLVTRKTNDMKIRYDITLKHKNDKKIYTIFETAPIIDENNKFFGSICGIIDISEKIRYQNELAKSQLQLEEINRSKDKFFSIIAHDLRSPLSGFLGLSKMLLEDYNELTENELQEYTESLYNSASQINKLLENLLEWSRLQRGLIEVAPEYNAVNDIINDIDLLFRINLEQKNIDLKIIFSEDLVGYFDKKMIDTVIRNIISNAIKFTHRNGKITVSGKYLDADIIRICVKDNGIGMSVDTMNKLFKIGETVSGIGTENESGSGLGLILCKELIEKNYGKISVTSQEKLGSEFCILLPRHQLIQS